MPITITDTKFADLKRMFQGSFFVTFFTSDS